MKLRFWFRRIANSKGDRFMEKTGKILYCILSFVAAFLLSKAGAAVPSVTNAEPAHRAAARGNYGCGKRI
jgi:hypothetical protein